MEHIKFVLDSVGLYWYFLNLSLVRDVTNYNYIHNSTGRPTCSSTPRRNSSTFATAAQILTATNSAVLRVYLYFNCLTGAF
jgi:hypothetical protein